MDINKPNAEINKVLEWFAMDIKEMSDGEIMYIRQRASRLEAMKRIIEKFKELDQNQFIIDSELIFNQLVLDGYLTKDSYELFSITFNGKLFSKRGGYTTDDEREKHQNRIQNLKDWLLIVGSFLAGIGTLLLFSFEVYKRIYPL